MQGMTKKEKSAFKHNFTQILDDNTTAEAESFLHVACATHKQPKSSAFLQKVNSL